MKINNIVTGCAGFIGSHIVDRLLKDPNNFVIGIDNFSTGNNKFIEDAKKSENFKFYEIDLLNLDEIKNTFKGGDAVFHLAANADVRFGVQNPRRDLEQNTIVTQNVLEAMQFNNIRKIIFSSTGSIYGEAKIVPTPENCPFPTQTSFYGASKIACEGLISAYCEAFNISGYIFRFVSILGERYTHGHIFDFYKKLKINPDELVVLGNGKQRKSYLYINDCIDGIFLALKKSKEKLNIFNLGVNDYCEVNDSIKWICDELNLNPKLKYTGGDRGWVGDNPFIFLQTEKICNLGWQPKHNIKDGIIKTLKYLKTNEWVYKSRI
jgi:UDP-glucose 4-epimerase